MAFAGDATVTIIQGDSCFKEITIDDFDYSVVDKVYFSCHYLGISKELEYDRVNDVYVLSFTPEETLNMRVSNCNFDITMVLNGGIVRTLYHKSPLKILKKSNKVVF